MERLDNPVRTYDWGDRRAIWDLLGVEPPGTPAAELWMGAHPVAPSTLPGGTGLDQVIGREPEGALGSATAHRFGGELPFLFKVLAAARALSLQAHPDAGRARAGFAREQAAGVPLDHPTRTYRDPHHKPELICAVTPFHARCGFRPLVTTLELLDELPTPALDPLRRRLRAADGVAGDPGGDGAVPDPEAARSALAEAMCWLLTRPAEEARALVDEVARAAGEPGSPRFQAERTWTRRLAQQYPGDPGVVVALLLNHVELQPGEALFLGAGNLHCYLAGVGVEVMANSDNVVRGGLTTKHVDVTELLAVVDPTPAPAQVQRPAGPVHTYDSPVPEFSLTRLDLAAGPVHRPAGPHIVLVVDGTARLAAGGRQLDLAAGQSAWVPAADGPLRLDGDGLAFDVTTGAPD